jgi:8-oxo-dGTP pyrophosphatase MutT (NUDIX family)
VTVTAATRHLTASAAVLDPDRRSVLVVHHILTGQWQLPGGHLDPDEDPADCAIREVLEETGVRALLHTPARLAVPVPGASRRHPPLMVAEHPAPADPGWGEPAHSHIDLLYVAVADSAAATVAQAGEVTGVAWLPVDRLDPANVRADVPVVVPLAWTYLTGETP